MDTTVAAPNHNIHRTNGSWPIKSVFNSQSSPDLRNLYTILLSLEGPRQNAKNHSELFDINFIVGLFSDM